MGSLHPLQKQARLSGSAPFTAMRRGLPLLVLLWTSPHLSSRAFLSLECLKRALQPVLESEWVTSSLR